MKVAFIEGRPHSHTTHALYAKKVAADFFFVDQYLPYHESMNGSKVRQYFSWIINAIFFPNKKKYNVFLTEEPYLSVVLLKKLHLIKKNQKIFSLLGNHTLYFLHTKKYSRITSIFLRFLFNSYDAIICEGSMQVELLEKYITNNDVKIKCIYNGNPYSRYLSLLECQPTLNNFNIVSIAGIPNEERMYYKGIDLMIDSFAKALNHLPYLTYTIVGDYNKVIIGDVLSNYPSEVINKISFVGLDYDLLKYLKNASLYLHTARGEAWGVSITEAMLAGIPTIVSEWTGSKDIVKIVDDSFILKLDSDIIANKIISYFKLDDLEKLNLSKKFKSISSLLTEEKACENFKHVFDSCINENKL